MFGAWAVPAGTADLRDDLAAPHEVARIDRRFRYMGVARGQ